MLHHNALNVCIEHVDYRLRVRIAIGAVFMAVRHQPPTTNLAAPATRYPRT